MKISRKIERVLWFLVYTVSFLMYFCFRPNCSRVTENNENLDISDIVQDEFLNKFVSIFKIRKETLLEYLKYSSQSSELFPKYCEEFENPYHELFHRFFLVHCYLIEMKKISIYYIESWYVNGQKNVGRIYMDTLFEKILKERLIGNNKNKIFENCIEWGGQYMKEYFGVLCKKVWTFSYKKGTTQLNRESKKLYMSLDDKYPPEVEGFFDLIVMTNVHEHLKTVEDSSRNLGKITKKGGYVLVIAPHSVYYHRNVEDNYRFTLSGLYHAMHRFGGFCAQNLYKLGNTYTHLAEIMKFDIQKFPNWLKYKKCVHGYDLYPYASGIFFRPREGEKCDLRKYPIPLPEKEIERL